MPKLRDTESRRVSIPLSHELYAKLYALEKSTNIRMPRFILMAIKEFLQDIELFNVYRIPKKTKK